MPRAPRVEFEGAQYHLMCRGDRRETVFLDDKDRELFVATLQAYLFTFLTALFVSQMLPHGHHDEGHEEHGHAAAH